MRRPTRPTRSRSPPAGPLGDADCAYSRAGSLYAPAAGDAGRRARARRRHVLQVVPAPTGAPARRGARPARTPPTTTAAGRERRRGSAVHRTTRVRPAHAGHRGPRHDGRPPGRDRRSDRRLRIERLGGALRRVARLLRRALHDRPRRLPALAARRWRAVPARAGAPPPGAASAAAALGADGGELFSVFVHVPRCAARARARRRDVGDARARATASPRSSRGSRRRASPRSRRRRPRAATCCSPCA